jgi:hypothetical protein
MDIIPKKSRSPTSQNLVVVTKNPDPRLLKEVGDLNLVVVTEN